MIMEQVVTTLSIFIITTNPLKFNNSIITKNRIFVKLKTDHSVSGLIFREIKGGHDVMRKLKSLFWALICFNLAGFTTYKLTYVFFYYIASTNNTSAPFAAFVTSIPFGFVAFHFTSTFYKNIIKMTRRTLHAIA